ncbi:MAG: 50S ribosomal protein L25 [Actinobacteria bacterium]|nr:50S ribosomal protein L25 [Actinomycetota bacterium]
METIKLTVQEREETGNGPARRLRAQGLIPGVSYSKGKEATALSIALDDFKVAMKHGHNVVLELDFGGSGGGGKAGAKTKAKAPRYAVVKQLQFHPTKRSLLHVDLHEVDLTVEIEALVAIEPVGTPAGLADGGIMEWERREVTVRALPGDVPAMLELDVSGLEIGHHLLVEALNPPAGVTIVEEPDSLLVALIPPRVEEEVAAVEEGEEPAEPEVVGTEGSEEEGEE